MTLLLAALLLALPPSPAAAQSSSEIVELADGSFVRGTIVERVEGSHLVVQTATGELRRVPLDEVVYAGPVERRTRHADGSPASMLASPVQQIGSAPPSYEEPRERRRRRRGRRDLELEVTARGGRTDLVLHALTGSATGRVSAGMQHADISIDAFSPVCVAPCTADLDRGAYVFGVARGQGRPMRMGGTPFQLDDDARLELEYLDRGAERVIGWAVFFTGLLGGGAIALLPVFDSGADWQAALIAGGAIAGISVLVALPLMLFEDGIRIRLFERETRSRR